MTRIQVSSEIGTLKKVIVHRPNDGIDRLTPKRFEELLFDDIVHLSEMRQEHDIFTDVLKAFVGSENVIGVKKILIEALAADLEITNHAIAKLVDLEELPDVYLDKLIALSPEHLAETLITGCLEPNDELILFDPIPNFIFTRDIAVTVNDHIIITKAAKEARSRENFLTAFIFSAHPFFKKLREEGRIIDMNDVNAFPPSKKGEAVSVEGGDCMILSGDYFLIGKSERTSSRAIELLRDVLLRKGIVKNVVQVTIPADRSFMHIDTIFTRISEDHLVCYKPIVIDGLSSYVDVYRSDGPDAHYSSVKEFMLAEINPKMQFILVGGGESPYQEREQWTDGANLVALKPGVGITYDRNIVTEKIFQQHGFQVIRAIDLLGKIKQGVITPAEVQNTIITLPSAELSRARGGSHCMTCPIERN